MSSPRRPRVGLALGSGSARGWAHVGVIRALEQAGIRPDVVCGTSIGALVGAAYAAGELERFEQWLRGLSITDVLSFMDVGLTGGVIKGERLMNFFRRNFSDRTIEDLTLPFGAVATALHSGRKSGCARARPSCGAGLHRAACAVYTCNARGPPADRRRPGQSGTGIARTRDGRRYRDRNRPSARTFWAVTCARRLTPRPKHPQPSQRMEAQTAGSLSTLMPAQQTMSPGFRPCST